MNPNKVIKFTERLLEMVEEIKARKGFPTFTAVVHAALIEMYTRMNPDYKATLRPESPEDRVKRRKAEKDVKAEMVRSDSFEVVALLGGQIITEAGKEFCKYFTYSGKKRFEQKVPLNMLSNDLVITQFQPSREKVEILQKEGKVDYQV